jgi:hypothetical protein
MTGSAAEPPEPAMNPFCLITPPDIAAPLAYAKPAAHGRGSGTTM